MPPFGAAEMGGTPSSVPICLNRAGARLAASGGVRERRREGPGRSCSSDGWEPDGRGCGAGSHGFTGPRGQTGPRAEWPENHSAVVVGDFWLQI